MHSLGMGFTVAEGVTVTVSESARSETLFNAAEIDFPTVRTVIAKLTDVPLRVEILSALPLSGGFGLSGASSLATAFAVNALLGLGNSEEELGMRAHVAEVENLTGLGDVGGQFHGGCLVKLRGGDPLGAIPLAVPEQVVYYRYFSPIHTKEVIGHPEQRRRINAAADTALEELTRLKNANESEFTEFIAVAKKFAIESGLLHNDDVCNAIQQAEHAGGAASMIMLGNAVFSTVAFPGAKATRLANCRVKIVE